MVDRFSEGRRRDAHRWFAIALALSVVSCGTPSGPTSTTTTSSTSSTTSTSTTTSLTTSTTTSSTSTTTTTVPGVTAFYGRYQVTFQLVSSDPCGTVTPPGTATLSGKNDGSSFGIELGVAGGVFEYDAGQINSDGTFNAVAPGSQNYPLFIPLPPLPNHLIGNGTKVAGQVTGNNISATQTIIILPNQCTPTDTDTHTIIISFSGSRG